MTSSKDETALNKLIENYEQFYYNGYVALIDHNYVIRFMSDPLFNILQISSLENDVRGLTVMNIMERVDRPPEIVRQAQTTMERIFKHDVVADQIGINLQRDLPYVVLHYRMTPVHNKKTGNIIAIEAELSSLKLPVLLSNPTKLLKSGGTRTSSDDLLTIRQHEVLFLHFHCKSAKKIAETLSIIHDKPVSLHTIGAINKQLYRKFNVYNLERLLESAYTLGYNRKIPTSLLSDRTIDLLDL